MYKVIVLADDFTGANDTGVQLTKYGYSTVTILDLKQINRYKHIADSVVIDTETRSTTKQKAYKKMKNLTPLLKEYSNSILYKKIDSTLRGNIGIELRAINEVMQPDLIVFAPAFPKNERVTLEGIHYLGNTPVDETEIANDPKNPVITSNIKRLLAKDMNANIEHINLRKVRSDLDKVIQSCMKKAKVLSFDAEKNEDLKRICKSIFKLSKNVLWVGSAGLAEALISTLKDKDKNLPTLTVAGSVSNFTRTQIKKALKHPNISLVPVDIRQIFSCPSKEIVEVSKSCIDLIQEGKDVIISSATEKNSLNEAKAIAKEKKIELSKISEHIAINLSNIAFEVIDQEVVSGVLLTGGDTAVHVISKLTPDGFRINTELEPGIPEMTLLGGPFHGTKIVTKAGAFGNDYAILNAIKHMRGAKK